MKDATFAKTNARIERLSRHNLILKIIGFGCLLFVPFNFGTGSSTVEDAAFVKAQNSFRLVM